MARIPIYLLGHSSGRNGRYLRQPRSSRPRCDKCNTCYRASSTRQLFTWYYPRCTCAPAGGVRRVRPPRTP